MIKKNARFVAAGVLDELQKAKAEFVTPVLHRRLKDTDEKQRTTDLVLGTLRCRETIDHIITTCGQIAINRISARLINTLRIAVCELVYNPLTPDYSVINDAVENTKHIAGGKQSGFVNAILRKIQRSIKTRNIVLTAANMRNIIPRDAESGCEFNIELLPDAKTDLALYISLAFSLPKFLIAEWISVYGEQKVREICFASNRKPSVYIRVNPVAASLETVTKLFERDNVEYETADPLAGIIRIHPKKGIENLPGFSQGYYSVQDITAANPVLLLDPQEGTKILDLCAAPGTKTTQLAEVTKDNAAIFATDIDSDRLKRLDENIRRLNLKSITVFNYKNLDRVVREHGLFDYILLDVPCSNTGVLAKRPEVRYRLRQVAIEKLAQIQFSILKSAAEMLKPDGRICYSTCSIQPAENELLVKRFCEEFGFEIEAEKLILPSIGKFDHDGGYAAVLKIV